MKTLKTPLSAALTALLLAPAGALAHGDEEGGSDIGQTGVIDHIDRTIQVELGETNGGVYTAPPPHRPVTRRNCHVLYINRLADFPVTTRCVLYRPMA